MRVTTFKSFEQFAPYYDCYFDDFSERFDTAKIEARECPPNVIFAAARTLFCNPNVFQCDSGLFCAFGEAFCHRLYTSTVFANMCKDFCTTLGEEFVGYQYRYSNGEVVQTRLQFKKLLHEVVRFCLIYSPWCVGQSRSHKVCTSTGVYIFGRPLPHLRRSVVVGRHGKSVQNFLLGWTLWYSISRLFLSCSSVWSPVQSGVLFIHVSRKLIPTMSFVEFATNTQSFFVWKYARVAVDPRYPAKTNDIESGLDHRLRC